MNWQATNHFIRTADKLHKNNDCCFYCMASDRSMNDTIVFVIGCVSIHYFVWAKSPILFATWLCFGILCLSFLLTFVVNYMMTNLLVKLPSTNFVSFIESDVPLSNSAARKEAMGQFEENENLLAEEKFGIFLNRDMNKNKMPDRKKKNVISTSYGTSWAGLERQPQFMLMKVLAVIYMILGFGTNAYIYQFLVLGMGKFGLLNWLYEVI